MTLDQFLKRLRKTPRDWKFLGDGEIRRRWRSEHPQCPLTALVGLGEDDWRAAAEKLGIDLDVAETITDAADNDEGEASKRLRAKLLRACGLTEAR
jgi:hypothetical protein